MTTFSKPLPNKTTYKLDLEETKLIDQEGRLSVLEFDKFFLVNVYVPNSKRKLVRLEERINIWDKNFRDFLSNLKKQKTTIVVGDLNVSHKEIDLKKPKVNKKNPGFTQEERDSF